MNYDPEARRDTPLALQLKQRIRASGAIPIAAYMTACLQHPQHGYYVKQRAIGAEGDFITGPEISQVFGELIGLWAAVVWQQMGSPRRVNLIELGPGRGTLMADALRAARRVPAFFKALHVRLVESNTALRLMQAERLTEPDVLLTFHPSPHGLFADAEARDPAPSIVIGNEFLDTFPIAQFVFHNGAWRTRTVSLDGAGALQFAVETRSEAAPAMLPGTRPPREGDIFETSSAMLSFVGSELGQGAQSAPLAALFIDYGHDDSGFGDTLQSVTAHHAASSLFAPGEADLTAQVDFAQVSAACRSASSAALAVDGPTTQAEFLGRLGIIERASKLISANPERAGAIEHGIARLMAPNGMGTRFKAIGVRSARLPPLPGFEVRGPSP